MRSSRWDYGPLFMFLLEEKIMEDTRKVFIRTPYNYDMTQASIDAGCHCFDVTRTLQAPKDEADINVMMRRFGVTGRMPVGASIPTYGDFTHVGDYHGAVRAVRAAGEAFEALPSQLRERFSNDPGRYVDFCLDPANHDELVKLGLATKRDLPPSNSSATIPSTEAKPEAS